MLKAKSLSLQIFMRFLATSSSVTAWQSATSAVAAQRAFLLLFFLVQFTRLSPPAPFIDDRSASSLMKTANHSKNPQKNKTITKAIINCYLAKSAVEIIVNCALHSADWRRKTAARTFTCVALHFTALHCTALPYLVCHTTVLCFVFVVFAVAATFAIRLSHFFVKLFTCLCCWCYISRKSLQKRATRFSFTFYTSHLLNLLIFYVFNFF